MSRGLGDVYKRQPIVSHNRLIYKVSHVLIIAKIFDIDETEGDILFYKVEKLGFSWSDVDEMIFFFLKGGRCVTSVLRDIRKARRTNRLGPDGL